MRYSRTSISQIRVYHCNVQGVGPAMQDYIIAPILPHAEYLELLDISMHIATCTNYNDGTYHECTTNYSFTHVNSVRNVTRRSFSSSTRYNYFNWEKFCKAKGLSLVLEKFVPNPLYSIYSNP